MAIERPKFVVPNLEANRKAASKISKFIDIPANEIVQFRLLPPWDEQGLLSFRAVNHYRFTENGEKRAWTCLATHGALGESCPICEIIDYVKAKHSDDTGMKAITTAFEGIKASTRFYVQAIEKGLENQGPRLMGVPQTGINGILDVLGDQSEMGKTLASDPGPGGEWLGIKKVVRSKTEYKIIQTGNFQALDDIFPGWQDRMLNVPEAVGLNLGTRARVLRSLAETYSNKLPLESCFGNELIDALTV